LFVATVALSLILGALLVVSAIAKFQRNAQIVQAISSVGVPLSWFPFLGAVELCGAVGLIAGLGVAPLGIAAAVGLVLYFTGAEIAHLRVGHRLEALRPFPLLVLSAAAGICRALSS
jgi:hypothetical protein